MVRLAILPDGLGGNGSTSCATLALGAATIRQNRLTASSSAFVAQNIAAPSIIVFALARGGVRSSFARSRAFLLERSSRWAAEGSASPKTVIADMLRALRRYMMFLQLHSSACAPQATRGRVDCECCSHRQKTTVGAK